MKHWSFISGFSSIVCFLILGSNLEAKDSKLMESYYQPYFKNKYFSSSDLQSLSARLRGKDREEDAPAQDYDQWPVDLGTAQTAFTESPIIDLDGDGRKEVISVGRTIFSDDQEGIYVFPLKPEQPYDQYRSPFFSSNVGLPVSIGDLDGDPTTLEFVYKAKQKDKDALYAYRYQQNKISLLWRFGFPKSAFFSESYLSPILADLDGDQNLEVFAADEFDGDATALFVLDRNGKMLHKKRASKASLGRGVYAAAVGNILGTPNLEIVTMSHPYAGDEMPGKITIFDASLNRLKQGHFSGIDLALADIDQDQMAEIVALSIPYVQKNPQITGAQEWCVDLLIVDPQGWKQFQKPYCFGEFVDAAWEQDGFLFFDQSSILINQGFLNSDHLVLDRSGGKESLDLFFSIRYRRALIKASKSLEILEINPIKNQTQLVQTRISQNFDINTHKTVSLQTDEDFFSVSFPSRIVDINGDGLDEVVGLKINHGDTDLIAWERGPSPLDILKPEPISLRHFELPKEYQNEFLSLTTHMTPFFADASGNHGLDISLPTFGGQLQLWNQYSIWRQKKTRGVQMYRYDLQRSGYFR